MVSVHWLILRSFRNVLLSNLGGRRLCIPWDLWYFTSVQYFRRRGLRVRLYVWSDLQKPHTSKSKQQNTRIRIDSGLIQTSCCIIIYKSLIIFAYHSPAYSKFCRQHKICLNSLAATEYTIFSLIHIVALNYSKHCKISGTTVQTVLLTQLWVHDWYDRWDR